MKDRASWRQNLPVLVTEAHQRIGVGVIRSLGRAGYPVHACSDQPHALGFRSNFLTRSVPCPGYHDVEFTPWLRQYIREHQITCIVPTEGLLLAIRPAFDEFSSLLPLSGDQSTVYHGMSKFDLFQNLLAQERHNRDVASHLPPCLLVHRDDSLPDHEVLDQLGAPLFIKVDGVHSRYGHDSATYRAETSAEARIVIAALLGKFDKLIVQGDVSGVGVGAFFLVWQGNFLAEFMHMRVHEIPHVGFSSYSRSWWHKEINQDARAKLKHIDWEGVAMMEYRWNAKADGFALLEMNGRFWGSVHLAMYANVDFPVMLLDAFHGHIPQPVSGRAAKVRCRNTFPLEVQYVRSRLKGPNAGITAGVWSVVEFFLLMLHPKVRSDFLFPGDRKLYWIQLRQYLAFVSRRLMALRTTAS